ncbi:radical SAM protein [Caminibacter mediatlanticus TB-2]|uniref:Radical SAM protein n=1 Tax=Caminibacter mediatlanticus TB-2 TaxID=391592 RepID=A0ABX5V954_9BACT|nr:radical SAM protein [Caminibacter mediatlanticus]QCT94820.1 radical SAM protein [Caminibacter mediatlanticus TB-2]
MISYKYIFGPVASRRFGMSLGIDLSPDKKRCNFDCIYCELEPSKPISFYDNPPQVDNIIDEVKEAIKEHSLDVLTITSNGEPTLYPYLNELIDKLKPLNKKLLILSNSSTIMKKEIQNALKKLDIVKLSLDAITPTIFKKIDRPEKGNDINDIIDGIIDFRKIYEKELIIEILVVKGINDKIEEFKKLNEVLKKIKPNRVDISTIDRPPAYNVEGVSIDRLFYLANFIENQNIFIPTRKKIKFQIENLSKEVLLNTLKKRPFSESDIKNILDSHTQKIFNDLLKENLLEEIWVGGVKFYKAII